MTPKELAAKFHNCLRSNCSIHDSFKECEMVLADEFYAAINSAFTDGFEECNRLIPIIEKEAREKAYKEAAKTAEFYPTKAGLYEHMWAIPNMCRIIAEEIRALKSKGE
jgi:hypothetical protein